MAAAPQTIDFIAPSSENQIDLSYMARRNNTIDRRAQSFYELHINFGGGGELVTLTEIEARAAALLEVIDAPRSTKAASGRYLRSSPIRRGVRYWATTQGRYSQDLIGVQFFGQGIAEGEKLSKSLERAGFLARTPQKSQLTYARLVEYGPDGRIDETAVRNVRRQIDDLLGAHAGPAMPGRSAFRAFMAKSPLADVELILPDRDGAWRKEVG